ncbi:MAG: hypothetical protein KDD25_04490 [Bdellovibrionales bacterium]|nr:hypothetical protein [Bdellovibrionales bacterium]
MNIRGISNILAPDTVQKKERTTDSANKDRDPQSNSGNGQEQKRKFSQEELEIIVKNIKKLSGFDKNNLRIKVESTDVVDVITIVDHLGNTVRRLAGTDLNHLLKSAGENKGHIFDRAM